MAKKRSKKEVVKSGGASLGVDEMLWLSAGSPRNSVHAAEYRHVALGLLLRKNIPDAFQARREKLGQFRADPGSDNFNDSDLSCTARTFEERSDFCHEFWQQHHVQVTSSHSEPLGPRG